MMPCHFTTLSSKYKISCAAKCINTSYISLDSPRKHLSCNINLVIMDKEFIQFQGQEFAKRHMAQVAEDAIVSVWKSVRDWSQACLTNI